MPLVVVFEMPCTCNAFKGTCEHALWLCLSCWVILTRNGRLPSRWSYFFTRHVLDDKTAAHHFVSKSLYLQLQFFRRSVRRYRVWSCGRATAASTDLQSLLNGRCWLLLLMLWCLLFVVISVGLEGPTVRLHALVVDAVHREYC